MNDSGALRAPRILGALPWVLWGSLALSAGCSSVDVLGSRPAELTAEDGTGGGTGSEVVVPNLLEERQQIPTTQVNAQLNAAFLQLFFGDPATEAVFRDQGDGTGYIEDTNNNDVRTDSTGYGMLVTVGLDQRETFDKLWAWTKQYMAFPDGPSEGLLRWRCATDGTNCATSAATDSSSVIVTSLFIAAKRWPGGGAHDYQADALALLRAMTEIETRNGGVMDGVYNCFDTDAQMPRLSSASPEPQVPTDYLMPAFYDVWAEQDPNRAALWSGMADNARTILEQVAHPSTGLIPGTITYAGDPVSGMDDYTATTSRTFLNLALDHLWNAPSAAVLEQNARLLDFFLDEGIDDYAAEYTLAGMPLVPYNNVSHRALVALSAGISRDPQYDVFLEDLLAQPIPTGDFRYYDGMMYMLSLLTLSGQMTPP